MECMCLHSHEYMHVPMCVSTCVHVWWKGEQRSTLGVCLLSTLSFEMVSLNVEFPGSAAHVLNKVPHGLLFLSPQGLQMCATTVAYYMVTGDPNSHP